MVGQHAQDTRGWLDKRKARCQGVAGHEACLISRLPTGGPFVCGPRIERHKARERRTDHEYQIHFVTGGVLSSLEKGWRPHPSPLCSRREALRVSIQKLDPYIRVDPGTMNPFQHGGICHGRWRRDGWTWATMSATWEAAKPAQQLYVRTDLQHGHHQGTSRDYLGGTVQVIPHITGNQKFHTEFGQADLDVTLVEIGGTVGDIEGLPFRRGHPTVACGSRQGQCPLYSPDPGSVHQDRRGSESQAHAAFGQGTARSSAFNQTSFLCRSEVER